MLDWIEGPVASFTGDGAYDRDDVYAEVAARHPGADVIVPPRSSAVPSDMAETAPTRRDGHLHVIAERPAGLAAGVGVRLASSCGVRRLQMEARPRRRAALTDGRQQTEVAIAAGVLNCMLELGRPGCVRIT